jgi:DNA-binding beta-propeller fold protein YncE
MRDQKTTTSRNDAWAGRALLVAITCTAVLFGAPPALAATGHGFSASFGQNVDKTDPGAPVCTFASGDECGQGEVGSGDGEFSGPSGVAVSQATGDVYVADEGNNRVQYFDAAGGYLGQFDGSGTLSGEVSASPSGQFSSPDDLAVDNSTSVSDPSRGDVYVLDSGHNVIDKYSPTGEYIGQITEAASGATLGALKGVAVDPNGELWVYQASNEIDNFSDAVANQYLDKRNSPFGTSLGFGVNPEEDLYVNRGAEVVAKLNEMGEPLIEEVDGDRTTGVAVDPSSSDVYIDNVTSIAVFDNTGSFIERFGFGLLNGGVGVAVNATSGAVYVADAANDDVDIFVPGSLPSAPITEPAREIVSGSAQLNGTLTSGSEKVEAYFSYDTGPSCTAPGAKTTATISAEANSKESTSVTELGPDEQYSFCLLAKNRFGSSAGAPLTFTSAGIAPTIGSEESATSIESTSATLEAQVNPNNAVTHYYFEYSTSPTLTGATTAPAPPGTEIPAGLGNTAASQSLIGLQPNTTYYYRVVAENPTGTSTGAPIASFTTAPTPPTATSGEATAVAQTTATVSGVVNGEGADTHYVFQYVEEANYRPSEPNPYIRGLGAPSGGTDAGIVSEALPVSTVLTGLQPNTTYHYRVDAGNVGNCFFGDGFAVCFPKSNIAFGADATFTTLPLIPALALDPAASVNSGAAMLAGEVVPQGAATSYHFEYGTSELLGTTTQAGETPADVTSGYVTAMLEHLQPATKYYYRLVASNGGGEERTAVRAFTTSPTGEAETVPAPGFSLTGVPPAGSPAVVLPDLGGLTPMVPASTPRSAPPIAANPLTRAQKLTRALKACKKKRSDTKRASCERQARKMFGKASNIGAS